MIYDDGGILGRLSLFRDISRKVANHLKENDSPLGDALEKVNNTVDSYENFKDSLMQKDALNHWLTDLTVEEAEFEFEMGDHIAVRRAFYTHHGIYDGYGGVYEYNDYEVRHSSLSDFAEGSKVYKFHEDAIYSPSEIIYRARSRLGEEEYNLLYNNCQNFATWCRLGEEI